MDLRESTLKTVKVSALRGAS